MISLGWIGLLHIFCAISKDFAPEILTMPMPPIPDAVAIAAMVSFVLAITFLL